MSQNNKKQFGVWMDTHQATIVGRLEEEAQNFSVLGYAGDAAAETRQNEQERHDAKTSKNKFFKEITSHMVNAGEVHVTGTGKSQEQFIHFLAETPQFKNTVTTECTSNKMSDERFAEFIAEKFNKLN
jgi:stalled ribosome rescue protein Dom34